MREITRKVYETDDGKVFDTEAAAKEHEAKRAERAKRTTYWSVRHGADTTEGRGLMSHTVVECYGPEYMAEEYMQDWCYRTFGRPITFVQGVAPTPAWTLRNVEPEAFRAFDPKSWGTSGNRAKLVHLVLGDRETGLIAAKPEA